MDACHGELRMNRRTFLAIVSAVAVTAFLPRLPDARLLPNARISDWHHIDCYLDLSDPAIRRLFIGEAD